MGPRHKNLEVGKKTYAGLAEKGGKGVGGHVREQYIYTSLQ